MKKTWKIQTSEEKFKIIPIAQYKKKIIYVNGRERERERERERG